MTAEFPQSLPTINPSPSPEGAASIVLPEATTEPTLEELKVENSKLREQVLEERMAKEAYLYMATHDELTQTLNRKGLELALQHYSEEGSQVAFLFVDGLNIKAVNHFKGQDAGDQVIKGMADILERGMRSTDIVARIGGDEFLVALDVTQRGQKQRTAIQQLGEVQMRISTETEKYKEEHPEFAEVGFEVSVGYAIWEAGMTVQAVKAAAERVMKEHKHDQHERLGAFRQLAED
jgi:diguanylate cyclase (GGDEF)-like protein